MISAFIYAHQLNLILLTAVFTFVETLRQNVSIALPALTVVYTYEIAVWSYSRKITSDCEALITKAV